jgi:hypothetical protein
MAKKKTKKTPKRASRAAASATGDALREAGKSSAVRQAQVADEWTVCWLRLLAKLDEIQVDAREYFKHGPRISEAEIDAELERHPKRYPHGRADVEWGLAHRDRLQLAGDLSRLWNRLPAIGVEKVGATGRDAVADLLRALDALRIGDRDFEPDRSFSELVAEAMRAATEARDFEAARAQGARKRRKPSPLEAAILKVLLEADGSLSGEELASKVQRKAKQKTLSKAVLAAIGKLRADCGFPGLFASYAGFKLTPDERALATMLLGK